MRQMAVEIARHELGELLVWFLGGSPNRKPVVYLLPWKWINSQVGTYYQLAKQVELDTMLVVWVC